MTNSVEVLKSDLALILQRTPTAFTKKFDIYLSTAKSMLDAVGMRLEILDHLEPPLGFSGKYDPSVDMPSIRSCSEKQLPGAKDALRVIFADFSANSFAEAVTENAARSEMPGSEPFVIIDTARPVRGPDKVILLHEMIHAALMGSHSVALNFPPNVHDPDVTHVFASGRDATPRTVLPPEQARAISLSFYSNGLALASGVM